MYERGEKAGSFTVTFDTQTGAETSVLMVSSGEAVHEPGNSPIKIGSVFTGWFTDAECTEMYNFLTPVTADITLYAGWFTPAPESILKLPSILVTIDEDAFSGTAAQAVIIPDTVTVISGNPFSGSAIIYVYGFLDSAAEIFASTYGFTFIPIDVEWMASR